MPGTRMTPAMAFLIGGRCLNAPAKDAEKEVNHMSSGGVMKQDSPLPLTFRQQGILTAVFGAAMVVIYTLIGIL
jgi:hypothetical protein